jgi:hypothetical protein
VCVFIGARAAKWRRAEADEERARAALDTAKKAMWRSRRMLGVALIVVYLAWHVWAFG